MFQHRRREGAVDSIQAEDIGSFPDCGVEILMVVDGLKWSISECAFVLKVAPAAGNPVRVSMRFEYIDGRYEFTSSRPSDKRARATYKYFRNLNADELAKLLEELREQAE
jgi:hypothetical protein